MNDQEANPQVPPLPTPRAEGRWRAIEGILQTHRRSDRMQAGEKALLRLRAETEVQPVTAQAEGRWRAVEGVIQLLRRTDRMEAGEKALSRLRAGEQPAMLQAEGRTSAPYVHELMRRYVSGELGPLELDALQILMRCDPRARAELVQVCEELGQPVPAIVRDSATGPELEPEVPRQAQPRKPSLRRRAVFASPAGDPGRRIRHAWLIAAALLIMATGGLLWLWLWNSGPDVSDVRLSLVQEQEAKRRQEVLWRLEELDREAKDLAAAKRAVTRRTRPVPAPPETEEGVLKAEGTHVPVPQLDEKELARRKEEAEKCARLLDLRRLLVEAELASLKKPKRSDESDGDDEGPEDVAVTPAAAPEVGRVVTVEGEAGQAVLVRGEEGTGARKALAAGTKLLRGDRIEIERGGEQSCASLELGNGTTIDLAATTTVRVLGRNAVRLETGRIYACVARELPRDQDPEYAEPFSLQTPAARYILQEASVDVQASPRISKPWTAARVDAGAVHVFNDQGHVMGHKGQEVAAGVHTVPIRSNGFRAPIWRGRNRPHPGLPIGKGHPLIVSDEDAHRSFSSEYALALAHTGEIDLRGIQVNHGNRDLDALTIWRGLMQEVAALRRGGLRNAQNPQLGATVPLLRPASGRCEDTVPVRSKAVDQLLAAARAARPELPLVVVASGSLTDLASAWLLDRGITERVVVVTRTVLAAWNQDAWAGTIVLEKYRCVICNVAFPADGLQIERLAETRWDFLADRAKGGQTDFSQFACVTVPGFVKTTQRARFLRGKSGLPDDFRFEPDPKGRTWLVKRTEAQRMAREFEATFMTGSGVR